MSISTAESRQKEVVTSSKPPCGQSQGLNKTGPYHRLKHEKLPLLERTLPARVEACGSEALSRKAPFTSKIPRFSVNGEEAADADSMTSSKVVEIACEGAI